MRTTSYATAVVFSLIPAQGCDDPVDHEAEEEEVALLPVDHGAEEEVAFPLDEQEPAVNDENGDWPGINTLTAIPDIATYNCPSGYLCVWGAGHSARKDYPASKGGQGWFTALFCAYYAWNNYGNRRVKIELQNGWTYCINPGLAYEANEYVWSIKRIKVKEPGEQCD